MDPIQTQDTIIVDDENHPVAVVLSYDRYLALMNRLEELEDMQLGRFAQAELEAWREDPSIGTPYDEFRIELLNEGC